MSGAVTGGAPGCEFGGDGVLSLGPGRSVVEFEQIGALAVDAFVVVGFKCDAFLAGGGVASAVGCIDGLTVAVVDHGADEGLVEALADGVVGDGCSVVEGGAVAAYVDHDFGGQCDVLSQVEQGHGVGSLLG